MTLRTLNETYVEMGLRPITRWEYVRDILEGWWAKATCLVMGHRYKFHSLEQKPYGHEMDIAWFKCQRCFRHDPRPRAHT